MSWFYKAFACVRFVVTVAWRKVRNMHTKLLTLIMVGKGERNSNQGKKDLKQKKLQECEGCFIRRNYLGVCVCLGSGMTGQL